MGIKNLKFKIIILVLILFIPTFAKAADIDFHVSIVGDGRLHPGDDVAITLLIENEAKVKNFLLNENTSQALLLATTAKDLRVEIDDTMLPIKVETINPQLIGDLPAGRIAKAVFRVKVNKDAKLGEYEVPIRLKYTKVTITPSSSGALITYNEDVSDLKYLKIEITKKDYDFSVESVISSLKTNKEGIVNVTIKNNGCNKIYDAVLIINTTPPLVTNPKAMAAYLGNIDVGEKAKASFKIYVMDRALNHSYPANLILKFKTSAGIPVILSKSVGLNVEDEDAFIVTELKSFITAPKTISRLISTQLMPMQSIPSMFTKQKFEEQSSQIQNQVTTIPSRGFVSLSIRNVGEDIRDAVAILSFDNPLIHAENMPYIGHFKKNETKNVLFYIKSTAPPGKYQACLMIKYRNKLGDEEISKKHYIDVEIKSNTPLKIEKIETENLAVGLKGNLNIILKNTINKDIYNIMTFVVSPDSSITPISLSSYLNKIKAGEEGKVKFRLKVSDEAISGSYNLYLIERYNLGDAKDLVSVDEVPIAIKPKMAYFEIVSIESSLYPDETGEIVIKIKNAGNLATHNSIVKLELNAPLTIAGGSSLSSLIGQSQPGLYFVGTLNPRDVATAKFRVSVDKDAGAGFYPVTIKIEYYDDGGYLHTSNPIVASVEVKEKPLITLPIAIAIFLALIALILAVRFVKEKKKQGKA